MVAGACVMVCGVAIAKSAEGVHAPGAGFALDTVGYMIHGIGVAPFLDKLVAMTRA